MTIATLDELQTRARFVRDIASNRCVYVVDGIDGFARVTSQRGHGHAVELLWTDPSEAARWADVLVAEPKITALSIETLLSRHLPKLAEESRLIGANWSDAPAEPEMTAKELDTQVRRYLMENFIEQVAKNRHVWVLKGGDIYATVITRHPAGGEALPVFADRGSAERAMDGVWAQTTPVRLPMGDFLQKTILWCVETRRRVAPAYVPGPGLVELHAWEIKALLSGHMPVRRVA